MSVGELGLSEGGTMAGEIETERKRKTVIYKKKWEGGADILRDVILRPLTTRPREDEALLLSERLPTANDYF